MMTFTLKLFNEHMDDFISHRISRKAVTKSTAVSNRYDLNIFSQYMKTNKIGSITGSAVLDFQDYLIKIRNNRPASLNRKLFTLKSYQNHLMIKDIENAAQLPFNKVLKLRAPKTSRPNFLNKFELKSLFEAINTNSVLGMRDYTIFALMYLIGLRIGELHRLDCKDINWRNNSINIIGKAGNPRVLTLTKEINEILQNYLAVRNNIYRADKCRALFISKKGNRIAIRTIQDNFKKLIKAAKIRPHSFNDHYLKVTPHTLRHTCATMLNESGVKILTIQNILGHQTVRQEASINQLVKFQPVN